MHTEITTGRAVPAPAAVAQAKNLIEDFFGLKVADGSYWNGEGAQLVLPEQKVDYFNCDLLSPTGRAVLNFQLRRRLSDEWVMVGFSKGCREWEEALQIAIDNFINRPQGGVGVLGEWRPDLAKLHAQR